MLSANDPISVTFDLSIDPGGNKTYPVFCAPVGMSVQRLAVAVNLTQNAGTAIVLRLLNLGTAGTATGGTVSAGLGGTAAGERLTAAVPAATTSMVAPYLAAGEWVGVQLTEQGAGWQAGDIVRVQFDAVPGKTPL